MRGPTTVKYFVGLKLLENPVDHPIPTPIQIKQLRDESFFGANVSWQGGKK
jgi:hypothetical protein